MPCQIDTIREHIEHGRFKMAMEEAHKIKGAAGNVTGLAFQNIAVKRLVRCFMRRVNDTLTGIK